MIKFYRIKNFREKIWKEKNCRTKVIENNPKQNLYTQLNKKGETGDGTGWAGGEREIEKVSDMLRDPPCGMRLCGSGSD